MQQERKTSTKPRPNVTSEQRNKETKHLIRGLSPDFPTPGSPRMTSRVGSPFFPVFAFILIVLAAFGGRDDSDSRRCSRGRTGTTVGGQLSPGPWSTQAGRCGRAVSVRLGVEPPKNCHRHRCSLSGCYAWPVYVCTQYTYIQLRCKRAVAMGVVAQAQWQQPAGERKLCGSVTYTVCVSVSVSVCVRRALFIHCRSRVARCALSA